MASSDLDDSIAVNLLTGVLYIGWLCILSGFAVLLGLEPMPTIQAWWPGLPGQVAAVGTGAAFIGVSKMIYDRLRTRWKGEPAKAVEVEPEPEPVAEVVEKKRKRNKKKKKRRRR